MADMSDLRQAVSDFVLRAAADALEITYQETNAAAPERTGALRQMIGTSGPWMQGDLVAQASIFCSAPYAEWTDAGAPAHQIPGAPWLAFEWKGVQVIFKERDGHEPAYVNHPGTHGTQWFNGGQDDGEPMASRWERALSNAAQ